MATVYEALAEARKKLAAAEKRALHAETQLYDGYMRAILAGLCTKLDWETPARNVADQAERITLAVLRARELYKASLSPNVPPQPAKPKEKPNGLEKPNG